MLNVLTIGNSFSQDATRYLHAIARKQGAQIDVINLYIGGCSLERHFRNMLSGERVYGLECNGQLTGFEVSLKEALVNRDWDIVTIQQASHFSFRKDTYDPYAARLVAYIRDMAPRARIFMHQTWAYEDGSERLREVAGFETAADMLSGIKSAYALSAEQLQLDGLIPSGEMMMSLVENGIPKVHRDTFHASLGLGRYAIALLWYHIITGASVADDSFDDLDEHVDPEQLRIARECVNMF